MNLLAIARDVLVLVHLIGFALLLGGWAVQAFSRQDRVTTLIRAGLGIMILSGLVLAIPFPAGIELDYIKLGVKLAIAVLIGALFGVIVTRERRHRPARTLFWTVGALAIVNAGIALIWR